MQTFASHGQFVQQNGHVLPWIIRTAQSTHECTIHPCKNLLICTMPWVFRASIYPWHAQYCVSWVVCAAQCTFFAMDNSTAQTTHETHNVPMSKPPSSTYYELLFARNSMTFGWNMRCLSNHLFVYNSHLLPRQNMAKVCVFKSENLRQLFEKDSRF
jgi:hypothetical protein